jgi:hypothetical protein
MERFRELMWQERAKAPKKGDSPRPNHCPAAMFRSMRQRRIVEKWPLCPVSVTEFLHRAPKVASTKFAETLAA